MDDRQHRRALAHWKLIAAGWSPPPPTDEQAHRILDDIATVDQWGQTIELTDNELATLRLLAEGNTMSETAARLGLRPDTVKKYSKRINSKLGARNTANAVHIADQQGLLEAA